MPDTEQKPEAVPRSTHRRGETAIGPARLHSLTNRRLMIDTVPRVSKQLILPITACLRARYSSSVPMWFDLEGGTKRACRRCGSDLTKGARFCASCSAVTP